MINTLNNLKLSIKEDERALIRSVEKKAGGKVNYFKILKKSLDARNKSDIKWIYSVEYSLEKQEKALPVYEKVKSSPKKVLIVGGGPAGLFCAIQLVRRGVIPVLIERGKRVEERQRDIDTFFQTRVLNKESNVQFGEGGAGTFSDGKLNTQTNSPLNRLVLETFVQFGAPEDILYLSKPHIGSDNLAVVVKNMREYLIKEGADIRFGTSLKNIKSENGRIKSALLSSDEELAVSELILAIGHSARDTFEALYDSGVYMEQKEFAVGVRIEHLQSEVGLSQYGENYKYLPAADYKLVSHAHERSAFSFCMCPGGFVMPAASEEGGVVVNGMSLYKRDGLNANSALVAQVKKEDYSSEHPLAAIEYQRRLERKAFEAGGSNYRAPVQLVGDFLNGRVSDGFKEITPTYSAGTSFADLNGVLPDVIASALKASIPDMAKRLKCFNNPNAILSGVESRTSSPVRITRDENLESVNIKGLYPIGEGAGYAGGITSAAADGIRAADKIAEKYS